jgi:hypothetical protein
MTALFDKLDMNAQQLGIPKKTYTRRKYVPEDAKTDRVSMPQPIRRDHAGFTTRALECSLIRRMHQDAKGEDIKTPLAAESSATAPKSSMTASKRRRIRRQKADAAAGITSSKRRRLRRQKAQSLLVINQRTIPWNDQHRAVELIREALESFPRVMMRTLSRTSRYVWVEIDDCQMKSLQIYFNAPPPTFQGSGCVVCHYEDLYYTNFGELKEAIRQQYDEFACPDHNFNCGDLTDERWYS